MQRKPFRRRIPTSEERRQRREARARREARRRMVERQRIEMAEGQLGESIFTDWEREFYTDLPERLADQGRGFYDPAKADPMDPFGHLSMKQSAKFRQISRESQRRIRKRQQELRDESED